jgi:multiple sugar transport system ATP-binding protein
MARVVLEKVSKTYPGARGRTPRPTIPGLDLEIVDGEFLVMVGPSGCGKSTALRLIAGLERATSGEIFFDDQNVTRLSPAERNVAFVFQTPALYPHMTAAANIGFPLRLARTPAEEVEARVAEVAKMLRMTEHLAKTPRQLSGGQQQRVAMGRAVVRNPDLFLLDEPLSNLDALLRVEMRSEISSLQRELGRTTVYVTHDGEEAMTMGQRVAVLRDGVLQQCGPPAELYGTPANAFVAGFVGNPQMNFVPGRLWLDREWQVAFGPVRLPLPESTLERHPGLSRREGEPVIIGFRPETVRVDPEASDTEALDVQVVGVQQLGNQTRVLFRAPEYGVGVGEVAEMDAITNKVGRSGELMMTISPPCGVFFGESLRLRINPESVHLFDAMGAAL